MKQIRELSREIGQTPMRLVFSEQPGEAMRAVSQNDRYSGLASSRGRCIAIPNKRSHPLTIVEPRILSGDDAWPKPVRPGARRAISKVKTSLRGTTEAIYFAVGQSSRGSLRAHTLACAGARDDDFFPTRLLRSLPHSITGARSDVLIFLLTSKSMKGLFPSRQFLLIHLNDFCVSRC